MEVKKLYLAWQDTNNRRWYPVGVLTVGGNYTYRFRYTQGALKSGNFVPFGSMDELYAVYESQALFPLFSNRLLPVSRPEYQKQMRWLDIKETEDISLYMLSMTGGIRATDTLEVFKCPIPNNEGQYEVDFFVHGLRHLAKYAIERVNRLTKGERLFLVRDIQNKFDSRAILLRTDDPVEFVGYCPRYLSPDFEQLATKNEPPEVKLTVERVNQDAPLNLRLLCKLVAPWPANFHPCSSDDFEPLVELPNEIADLLKNETPVEITGVSCHPMGDLRGIERNDISNCNPEKSSGMVDYFPEGGVSLDGRMPLNNSHYGSRKEQKVARQLRGHGASVKVSPASRGSADLKARFPSGKSWNVQVKSSRSKSAASPSRKDLGRLKNSASKSGATPVVAKVTPKGISYKSARSGRKLKP